jgi:hypothetical protein
MIKRIPLLSFRAVLGLCALPNALSLEFARKLQAGAHGKFSRKPGRRRSPLFVVFNRILAVVPNGIPIALLL